MQTELCANCGEELHFRDGQVPEQGMTGVTVVETTDNRECLVTFGTVSVVYCKECTASEIFANRLLKSKRRKTAGA